ncbi:MAG: hypothetical protein C5B49_05685 [Bdellovibrio sp.]|nr:MAG: hypothetical protein C5B49_05685 [Bdellovibrio sp.]
MKRIVLGCFYLFLGSRVTAEPASTVTIPIKEYLDLRKQSEKGSITTLEDTRIWGEWKKKLQISFAGATSGKAEPIAVLQQTPGVSLTGCSGSGILKAGDNDIELLPQTARFKVTCELNVKNWETLTLTVLNSLFLKTEVKGVDPVVSADTVAQRQVSFHRAEIKRELASEPINEEPSFQARYQISAMPEDTKYQYVFLAHNPNRSPKTFELKWQNGEVVSHIDTTDAYETVEKGINFRLVPGQNRIRVTGRFPGHTFKPLLRGKGLEYLLVDNHPLLTLDFNARGGSAAHAGGARRISIRDTGMSPSFAGGRAFLLSKGDEFAWESKQLEVFSAMTFGALKKSKVMAKEYSANPPQVAQAEALESEALQSGAVADFEGRADGTALEPRIAGDANTYQGLPAKIVIPNDGSAVYFNAGLLDNAGTVHLRFITAADWFIRMIYVLLVALLAWSFWAERARIRIYLHLKQNS